MNRDEGAKINKFFPPYPPTLDALNSILTPDEHGVFYLPGQLGNIPVAVHPIEDLDELNHAPDLRVGRSFTH